MEWYPRYPALWQAKTMHLNPYQDGCYMRLIDHYMITRQPLPDNDAALSRIIGISIDEWLGNASGIVRAFFWSSKGSLRHERCDIILDEQDHRHRNMTEKGKKGAKARWNKINDIDSVGIAQALPGDATRQDKTRQDNLNKGNGGFYGKQKPTGGEEGKRLADKIRKSETLVT